MSSMNAREILEFLKEFSGPHPKKLIFFPEGDHSINETYDREKAVNESLNWILNRLINT